MADLLIRNVPIEVLSALDASAEKLGLSRVEFIRRRLAQEAQNSNQSVTEEHLKNILVLLPDLAAKEIMEEAWR